MSSELKLELPTKVDKVIELDPNKVYLFQIEVGAAPHRYIKEAELKIRRILESLGITKFMLAFTSNGVGSFKVEEQTDAIN